MNAGTCVAGTGARLPILTPYLTGVLPSLGISVTNTSLSTRTHTRTHTHIQISIHTASDPSGPLQERRTVDGRDGQAEIHERLELDTDTAAVRAFGGGLVLPVECVHDLPTSPQTQHTQPAPCWTLSRLAADG